MIKKNTTASRKRKGEDSTSSARVKKRAHASSSELTESEVQKVIPSSPRSCEKFDPARLLDFADNSASSDYADNSASSDPDVITGFRRPPPAFPERAESTMDELKRVSETAVRLFEEALKTHSRTVEKTEKLEEENLRLTFDVSDVEAKVKELQQQLDDAKGDLAAEKESVRKLRQLLAAAEAREADLASTQGDFLRAFAERIFFSKKFSSLVSSMTKPSNARAVAEVLDWVAEDFPELDKGKYGYEYISNEVMLRTYGRALLKKTNKFPVVEALASQQTLLSAEEVRMCKVDRDFKFEARIAPVVEELKDLPLSPDVSEDEEEEGEEEEPAIRV